MLMLVLMLMLMLVLVHGVGIGLRHPALLRRVAHVSASMAIVGGGGMTVCGVRVLGSLLVELVVFLLTARLVVHRG